MASGDARRWWVIAAVLALLFALLYAALLRSTSPTASAPTPTRRGPAISRSQVTAPAGPASDDAPIADTDAPLPASEDPDLAWTREGADAPPCGAPMRPPSRIPPGATCVEHDATFVCATPLAVIPPIAGLQRAITRATEVVGQPRLAPLFVVLHDEDTWAELAKRKRLPNSVSGLYDGTVHVRPQPSAEHIETLNHEIFHAVLDGAIRCVPRSVHEGLASWFAAETRDNGWAHSLRSGFWDPRDLDAAMQRRTHPVDRAAGYSQAEARVVLAFEQGGVEGLSAWIRWLGAEDRHDPVTAWDALDAPTDQELRDQASDLLFGAPYDEELLRARDEDRLRCDEIPREWGPPARDCHLAQD